MAESFEDDFVVWKIQGSVLTMQRTKREAFSSCEDVEAIRAAFKKQHETRTNNLIERAKKRGITVIEFWVDPRVVDLIADFHAKHGRSLEVRRIEKDGNLFCRLLI